MKAEVDAEVCIGCGLCVEICPEVFEMNDNNIAVVKVDSVPAETESSSREAAENCPVEAIKVEE